MTALLDAPLGTVVVVRAPSGYGKSSVISEWVANTNELVVRLTVEAHQGDRAALWIGVLTRLAQMHGLENDHPAFESADRMRTSLVTSEVLAATLTALPPSTIVIDSLEDSDELDAIVADLVIVARQAAQMRFIIATRTLTQLDSPQVRLRVPVKIIDAAELAFTLDEVRQVVEAEAPSWGHLAPDVRAATGGVPILAKFAAVDLSRGEGASVDLLTQGLERRIDAFIADVVLSGAEIRPVVGTDDALLALAAADLLDDDLASALTGQDGAVLLKQAQKAGLGSVSTYLTGEGEFADVFRLNSLVLRALRRRATLTPELYARRRGLFARWAWEQGLAVDALSASVDAGDLALATDIVIDHWFDLGTVHRNAVAEILNRLDRRALMKWPILSAQLALHYLARKDEQWRSAELFGVTTIGFAAQRRHADPLHRFVFLFIEMVAFRTVLGRYDRARSRAIRLSDMLGELESMQLERAANLLPHAIAHISATLLLAGETDAALLALLSGSHAARISVARPRSRYFAVSLRAGAHALAGELDDAGTYQRASDEIPGQQHRHDDYSGSPARLAEAYLYLEAGDYAEALSTIERLHRHFDTIENMHLLLEAEAWALMGLNESHRALVRVDEVRTAARRQRKLPSFVLAHLERTAARVALDIGDDALAAHHAKAAGRLAPFSVALLRAQVELAGNKPENARTLLSKNPPQDGHTVRDRLEHRLALAAASARTGRRYLGISSLREAAIIIERKRLTLPLLAQRTWGLDTLMDLARDEGITRLVDAVEPFLASRSVSPSSAPLPNLSTRELAVLHALAHHSSYAQIAEHLFVSVNTVRTQVTSLYKKLGVRNRSDALSTAASLHLLDTATGSHPHTLAPGER
ncbi:helix-turn-helix transcriptional regulator [Rathayibacter caricis]|uniref:helix-turn-helix transcriptional regulator n=1 Tax=Rathayibacter caricis TaxID=110936 RepID=UPI001473104F|nr:LuxR C-terminal-related transcriptional regulator [Rathayibacter caricis]